MTSNASLYKSRKPRKWNQLRPNQKRKPYLIRSPYQKRRLLSHSLFKLARSMEYSEPMRVLQKMMTKRLRQRIEMSRTSQQYLRKRSLPKVVRLLHHQMKRL